MGATYRSYCWGFRNVTIPKRINDVDISFREFYCENVFDQQRNKWWTKLNIYAADVAKGGASRRYRQSRQTTDFLRNCRQAAKAT